MNKTVAILGGTGFIGSRFVSKFSDDLNIRELNLRGQDISKLDLKGVESVVFSVGIAHVKKAEDDPEFYQVNEELALEFAKHSKAHGVKQFIYISSTMVYGEGSSIPYTEYSLCTPVNAAGKSKQRAEIRIQALKDDDFKVAVIRPSLVYGKGVKGNLYSFLKLADSPLPLPFKNIDNSRAMVSISTLIDAIYRILEKKMEGTFVVSDRETVSTEELMLALRKHLGRSTRLFKLPNFVMRLFAKFRPHLYNKLFGSFTIDCTHSLKTLELDTKGAFDQGIKEMVDHYKASA